MQYTLVEGNTAKELVMRVNEFLAEGWTLQGGISVACHYSGSIYYTQAIVRK
jgi:hypothetical protein